MIVLVVVIAMLALCVLAAIGFSKGLPSRGRARKLFAAWVLFESLWLPYPMQLDALTGLNFEVPSGPLAGIRFAVEAGLPVHQRLDGPQFETDWTTTIGAQYAF